MDKPVKDLKQLVADLKKGFCFKAGDAARPESARVDVTGGDYGAGLITDVVMAQAGEATGWGYSIEQPAIEQVVALTNAYKKGLKCRFEHPDWSGAKLGTAVGVLKNARVVGDMAVADLHILKSANKSPEGVLGDYVLSLAEEQPDFISLSIFGSIKDFYFYDKGGNSITIISSEQWSDYYDSDSKLYITISILSACDLVDEGALTVGLFAASAQAFTDNFLELKKISFTKTMSKPKRMAFAINAKTDADKSVVIKTDATTPVVGDQVFDVADDDTETATADGDIKISGGTLDGYTITVKDGKIEAITEPVAASAADDDKDDKVAASVKKAVDAAVKPLIAKIAKLEATPLAAHAGAGGNDAFNGNGSPKATQSEYEKIALERKANQSTPFPKIPGQE